MKEYPSSTPSGETGPVKLDRAPRVPKIFYNLVSISGLCDDGSTVRCTKNSWVIKMKKNIVGFHSRMSGMYDVDFKNVGEQQVFVVPENDVSTLDVWHARQVHVDCRSVK